ncbi:phosphoenolpyruvate--protein phosphotransferase [Cryobacterium suzukii]|uniref:Phosphoenolpyruvate-protein phosphotransferase n=1 Tax=Cryobacterium suzukii TaxID=1259198 RepID=A0A4R9AGA5_9MICO|nr:phosphoenolpyruvate--protein phosphotransferase [Cryobacterium suzukii]TFD61469.1 phosphoenolpyruvate--protein phosphotransferase [Cryobacterium suzukii]
MKELCGIGVGRAMAVGPVLRMPVALAEPARARRTTGAPAEQRLVSAAFATVSTDLLERAEAAGGEAQEVLEAQSMMAMDPTLVDDVNARIDAGSTGERAVFDAFAEFAERLIELGGYLAERAADLHDVAQRVIAVLRGVPAPGLPESLTPYILVARDLAPADTVLLDPLKVLALVTRDGGPTSHTAILARSLSLPAVVGVEHADDISDGTILIVDAETGRITMAPSADEIATAEERIARLSREQYLDLAPGALRDGEPLPLLANLGSSADCAQAVRLGAEGVGLFRTEFLFLDSTAAPTVAEQQAHYTSVLAAFPGQKVVVRCLDAGADKPLKFLHGGLEENPALGLRGLRALRANEAVLRDQLTALAGAERATSAELWVMAPMVTDLAETRYFVELARELGIRVAGVMAEIPALALMADQVALACDFVSIGTNDLTQYTMAADRMLGSVASYQDPWHPAVLRLVKLIGNAGHSAGTPVGVCGEAASDPLLAVVLVGLGATSLSMTPAALVDVRAELLRFTRAEAARLATQVLGASSAAEARALAQAFTTA